MYIKKLDLFLLFWVIFIIMHYPDQTYPILALCKIKVFYTAIDNVLPRISVRFRAIIDIAATFTVFFFKLLQLGIVFQTNS